MPPKKRGRPASTSRPVETDTAPAPPKSKSIKRASTSAAKPASTSTSTAKSQPKPKPNPKADPKPSTSAVQDPTPQIRAAFDSYTNPSPSGDPIITVPDVSRALRALRYPLPPKDFFDKEQEEEGLGWEEFRELAETLGEGAGGGANSDDRDSDGDYGDGGGGNDAGERYEEGGGSDGEEEVDDEIDEEVKEAFALFTQYQPPSRSPAGTTLRERRITVQDLARIAMELKEDVSEDTLRLMVEEASGEMGQSAARRGVGLGEFEGVMRRCGVIK